MSVYCSQRIAPYNYKTNQHYMLQQILTNSINKATGASNGTTVYEWYNGKDAEENDRGLFQALGRHPPGVWSGESSVPVQIRAEHLQNRSPTNLLNGVISEQWIGKDVEGTGCSAIWETTPAFDWRDHENHENIATVAGLRAEIWTRDLPKMKGWYTLPKHHSESVIIR
jgi:hypothetical protein